MTSIGLGGRSRPPIEMTTANSSRAPRRSRAVLRGLAVATIVPLGSIGVLVLSTPVAHASSGAAPTTVDMGTLGGVNSRAGAVSGSIVVGASQTPENGFYHAFAYDLAAATPTMLDLGTLRGSGSAAGAVDGNIVVGSSDGHAFAFDLDAATPTMLDLGTLGGTYSSAAAVSGDIVVGTADTAEPGHDHGFIYDLGAATPKMLDLGTLGGSFSSAVSVSGNIVAGSSVVPGDTASHAYAYDLGAASPVMRDLGTLGGWFSVAVAVSGHVVVGYSATADSDVHAFAYDLSAPVPKMLDLGTLGGTLDGDGSNATAVSGTTVVGYSYTTGNDNIHAFAYDIAAAAPSMRDLGSLGLTSFAYSISGNIVVGISMLSTGAEHAFAYDLGAASPAMQDLSAGAPIFSSSPSAVNSRVVVGQTIFTDHTSHATAWIMPTPEISTATSLTASLNPATVAAPVTYTATVSPAPDGGTVAFHDGTGPIDGCTAQSIDGTGEATCQVTYREPGSILLTARYSGDTDFAASTSPILSEQVAYGVKLLYSTGTRHASGAMIPIKVRLVDATGHNLSDPSIVLTVTGLSPDPSPGNRPSGTFDVKGRHAPKYQISIDTTHYPPGTYTLSFQAGTDPTTHTALFVIRRPNRHRGRNR